ncbi:MAG: hypothetical protein AAFR87_06370 [Bacteroidota bacterium]
MGGLKELTTRMLAHSNRCKSLLLSILLILCAQSGLQAQTLWQRDTLELTPGDTTYLSQKFLVPFSQNLIRISGDTLSTEMYQIAYARGWLKLALDQKAGTYILAYRYFSKGLKPSISFRNIRITRDTTAENEMVDAFFEEEVAGSNIFWETDRIRKSGSLSRGLTVGNNRGLSVNSGLRLQLEGDLGDGLKIVGAITDENLPIQPDGTTQQISDFDRVFVKLMKDGASATIGDYEVDRRNTRFANVYRNSLGMQLAFEGEKTKARISGAVAKGKFHTNSMMGIDGVSGPYRLTGQNGERFFIVLAGSERVYLNGKLMKRGSSLDYIINYNTAEVTFMPRHVITNITRIVIDFEYNDQYYNRSLVVADVEQKLAKDRVNLRFSYSRDADNPNAPFNNTPAYDRARRTLAQLGDAEGQAFTNGVDSIGFDTVGIRYVRRDTMIRGINYERYIRTTNAQDTVYRLSGSFVGQGNGFYTRDNRVAGGANVYIWQPPDSLGNPTGDFDLLRTWVLPRSLQVFDVGLDVKLTDKLKLYSEMAISQEDKNRLSFLDDDDNTDIANKTGILWEGIQLNDSLSLDIDLSHQYIGERYNNLDRLYQAEYGRIWDLELNELREENEQILASSIRLNRQRKWEFRAENGLRNAGAGNQTVRQVYEIQSYMPKFLQGNYRFTLIENNNSTLNRDSRWMRQEGNIYAPLGKFQPGVEIWIEDKERTVSDSLNQSSFSFIDLKPYFRTFNTKKFDMLTSFNYRKDRGYAKGGIMDKALAYTYFLQANYRPSTAFSLSTISSYRTLEVLDSVFLAPGLENSQVLSTKLEGNIAPLNRLISSNFVYEVSSERLAQREVRYIEVVPGQGQYVWLDSLFNNDGIQDFEEFQLANNPLVADFIRVIVPTRELFPTTRLSFNGNMIWSFKKVIDKSAKGLGNLIRNTRLLTNFRITQSKSRNMDFASYLIDFFDPFSDESLLDANYNLRQDISFFQNNPTGDLRFSYFDTRAKLFLSTGDEFRGFRYGRAAQRLNLGEAKSLEVDSRLGIKFVEAESFPSRNYDIYFWETNPKVNFQLNRKYRLSAGYAYRFGRNTNLNQEVDAQVNIHKLIFDAKLNLKDRNNILTKLELVSMGETGNPGFSAQYELREGLQPGLNAIWQVFTTYYILNNVELSITYDGRASTTVPIIHTGRVQVRAFF